MEVDDSVILTGEELKPLFKVIGGLLCQVDDNIHLKEAARTTKAGYKSFYDYVLEEKNSSPTSLGPMLIRSSGPSNIMMWRRLGLQPRLGQAT